jgi:2-polyprenyl-3-methyl-5-hydroxy-6-metoxy-1,4-benzoquinol methylase
MSNGKETWEDFGATDAYYAVATYEKFRSSKIDAAAKAEFFATGREHLDEVWLEFERLFGEVERPHRALDYGCGVGRILLPMAERCGSVVGVDISTAMLAEARKNADEGSIANVELQEAAEFIAADGDRYDLVHTYIVMQHIEPQIGYEIIRKLVERLVPGGLGMIHVTFRDSSPPFTRLRFRIYRDVPGVHKLLNKLRGRTERFMPMYEYDRNKVLEILKTNGCEPAFEKPTDHGFAGAMFFFRKQVSDHGSNER